MILYSFITYDNYISLSVIYWKTDAYAKCQEEARVWVEHMSDGMVQIKPS